MLERKSVNKFRRTVLSFYRLHGRHDLPWRDTRDPYRIAVSELMLQQTQVSRVIEKYKAFLKAFPTLRALAKVPLARVLTAWSGLGYNRRAKFLHALAKKIVSERKGIFPKSIEELESLPGIGPYTARAIAVFAYNQPVTCIETNIRTVFIHHFFPRKRSVSDTELLLVIEATLDRKDPRGWYSALMDYGTHLKQSGVTVHRKSAHYTRQSAFHGSNRQIRGAIIRLLITGKKSKTVLIEQTGFPEKRILPILCDLEKERLVRRKGAFYALAQE